MGEFTKIEWCDHTMNPWIGCQKVSAGCDRCYAEHLMDHRYHRVVWGPHGKRVRTSEQTWRQPVRWNARALADGIRYRVFCASLSDWLDNKVPRPWRSDLCALIKVTPALDWLLLTKRPENFRKLVPSWAEFGCPDNVWFGVTGEDQKNFDHRWPIAAQVPARVRFVSYEPAIGRLRLPRSGTLPDWIICGGETGHGRRFMRLPWARNLRDECAERGVAFFLKQMTGKAEIPPDLLVRQFPCGVLSWSSIRERRHEEKRTQEAQSGVRRLRLARLPRRRGARAWHQARQR
jgi:protein gp37